MAFMNALTADTSPEVELALCCARACMDSENSGRIKALLQKDVNWTYVLQTAFRHGVMSLLYWNLNSTCPQAAPKATLDYIQNRFLGNAKRNFFLTREMLKLLGLLEAHGIPAVPFKGPALATFVYGNLALREFVDLDILVHEHDVLRVKDLFASQGYGPQFRLNHVQEAALLRSDCELPFVRNDRKSIVDLQWRIRPRYFSFHLDQGRLWERLKPMSLGGKEVLTLFPEDLLLILCVHGAKHRWAKLKWVCDVAELIRVYKGISWEQVIEHAGALGSKRMLFLGLFLASDLLGASLPQEVLQKLQADPAVKSLAAQVRERLFVGTDSQPEVLGSSLFHLRSRERLRDRARYCLYTATTPTVEDWKSLQLPPSLFHLYHIVRPIRLFKKYGLGLLRRPISFDLGRFKPTPMDMVERMLSLAEVKPTDVVYDLGCGDGRVVVTAAKRYRARGVGVDIDPRRIAEAKANARKEGVEHLVTFMRQDAKAVDVSQATVVMLYLVWSANLELRETLQKQLQPGARIVSRDSDMGEWTPFKTEVVMDADGGTDMFYLWQIERPRDVPQVGHVNTFD